MLPTSPLSNRSLQNRKRNPAGRRQPVARSSSFLGALKNIVTAPLTWFGQEENNLEDVSGKRRRLGSSDEDEVAKEDGGSRKKRMRVSNPVEEGQLGYLDPPGQLFEQPRSAPPTSKHHSVPSLPCYPSSINRSTSVQTPSSSIRRMPSGVNRHTISPHRTSFGQADNMSRTMSMDPPAHQLLTRDITMTPSHDRFPTSVPREDSISPTRSPFRMRTSLTPQSFGSTFGPTFQHHREQASEPPTLEELTENPKFVRPPRELSRQSDLSGESAITLGSLAESQKHTRSPNRQHSSLMFGPNGSSNGYQSSSIPISAAEKALHELDIYKTPLLPTRLRGSTTIPEIFRPKPGRSRALFVTDSARDQKPRLGRAKGKGKEEVNGTKPYAGEGGMRKLLARRRQEEEEENKADKSEMMDDGRVEEEDEGVRPNGKGRSYGVEASKEKNVRVPEKVEKMQETIPVVPPVPKFDPSFDRNANREQSSLRVGRTRTSRSHIARPTSKSKNRFSAAYDDDDDDDMMGEEKSKDQIALEEAAKKVPVFSVPPGFSFAKPETAAIQHDLTGAKEPPMTSLPFSLTKPAATVSASTPVAKESKESPKLAPSFLEQSSTATPAKQLPVISLTAPTPETNKVSAPETSSTGSSIPNLFSNSAVLNKPGAEVPPALIVPNSAVLNKLLSVPSVPKTEVGIPNFFAKPPALNESTPVPSVPKTETGIPNFFANSPALNKAKDPPTVPRSEAVTPNFFANSAVLNKAAPVTPTPTNLSFAQPTPIKDAENPLWEGEEKAVEETKPPSFGRSPKPTPSLFDVSHAPVASSTFGGVSSDAQRASNDVLPSTFLFGESLPKPAESTTPLFSFGAPSKPVDPAQPLASTPEPPNAPTPVQADASEPQPVFGSAPTPFVGFGGSSSNTAETSKPAFTFGQPTQASSSASTTSQVPKPPFGAGASSGFSFGEPPRSEPAAENKPSSASPFSFGAAPATPPEKKASFTFGAPPTPASTGFSFGPSSGSNGTDVSHKPFLFGNTTTAPPRPVTPKNDQEFRMEESPTRDVNQKVDEPKPVIGGFSFSVPSATVGSSPFGQNNQNSQTAPFSFGAPSTPNPFGKPADAQEGKNNNFGTFGGNASSSGAFSFGQKTLESAPSVSRSTSAGFTFGQPQPAAPPQIASSFSFGATPANNNPFSQVPSNTGSAPSSPSTFNQPSPFSFTSPTTPSNNNAFAFGSSQPASPAGGNTGLPQVPGTPNGGFSFGQSNGATAPQTAAPFQVQPSTGGNLFTIGSAPSPAPGRPVKKLPRRGMSKR